MKNLFKKIKFEKVIAVIIASSAVILATSILLSVKRENELRNTPVDVLKNWTLEVDGSVPYKSGDILPVVSKFEKLLAVSPVRSLRFVQCVRVENMSDALTLFSEGKDIPDGFWGDKVPAPQGIGSADKGKNTRLVNLVVPYPLGPLPNICRANLNPTYNVNKYYPEFPENGYSNPFRVEPRPGVSVVDSSTTYVYTDDSQPNSDQAMISIIPQAGERVIIYQNPPATDPGQAQSQPDSPALLQRITTPIVRGVQGALDALSGR